MNLTMSDLEMTAPTPTEDDEDPFSFFSDTDYGMTPDNDTCQELFDTHSILHFSLIPSVLIVLALSFFERPINNSRFQDKVPLLNKRFGLMIPLDLLGAFNNRWTFGFAFGAIANKVISLFFEEYLLPGMPTWARAIGLLIGAIEVGLSFYPMFACLSTDCKLFGAVAGFLYTLAWFTVTIIDTAWCPMGYTLGEYEKVILNWPTLLCLAFLMGSFVLLFIKSIRAICRADKGCEDTSFLKVHQAEHVKRLLRKPDGVEKSWFKRKIFEWDPWFMFPSRMIGTSVLSLFSLYILVTLEFNTGKSLLQLLHYSLSTLVENSTTIEELNNNLVGIWYVSTFLSSIITVTYVLHILVCYRKHIRKLWAGKKSFLPKCYHHPSSDYAVAAIARYCGCQVAYVLWGYVIMHLVQFAFGIAFIYAFIHPLIHDKDFVFLKSLGFTVLTFVICFLLSTLQSVLAEKCFLQDKVSPLDKQKPLALNNRRGFHNFSYFFFFYNVIIGMASCLKRLSLSLLLGSFLIARIDSPILQRGYERADKGYKTWIGMLFVDHYHTNPALVCFCNILLTANAEKGPPGLVENSSLNHATGPRKSARARTRWLLWYTLLKNPRLIMQRKQRAVDDTDMDNATAQSRLLQASVMEAEIRNHQPKPENAPNEERNTFI